MNMTDEEEYEDGHNNVIGIVGAHRTGKTTLARSLANELGVPYIASNLSDICRKNDIDPSQPMIFRDRVMLQIQMLSHLEKMYVMNQDVMYVTDRSPLDCVAYLMFDVQPQHMEDKDHKAFLSYMHHCFDLVNDYFRTLVLLPPNASLMQPDPQKATAPLQMSYVETINTIIGGLIQDVRCDVNAVAIPRSASVDNKVRTRVIADFCRSVDEGEHDGLATYQSSILH